MRKRVTPTHGHNSGQALVLFAVCILGLVSVLALGMDGGNIYLHRRRMQNAADAGALAGARALALDATHAETEAVAQDYCVTRNGATVCTVSIDGQTVTVRAQCEVPMTFARVLGLEQLAVGAEASASWGGVDAVRGAAPITIVDEDYAPWPTQYYIWDSVKDMDPLGNNISGANRGWLNLDCQGEQPSLPPPVCADAGADLLKEWMNHGYPGLLHRYAWTRGSSGTETTVLQQASVGQVLVIPTFDRLEQWHPGKNYYHIVRFVAFQIDQMMTTGNPKGMLGHFVTWVAPGEIIDEGADGVRTFSLTQ